uniref:HMG box domain-containing protein n=1 Tax=Caenorhabditis tropicalis TaxID=1561998 RepID=A0A1I7V0N2_9PELO
MLQTFSRRLFATKVTTSHVTAVSSTSKFPVGMKISPYAMYIKENFKKENNMKNTDVVKDLSVKWKEMSIVDKKKYSDLSQSHNEKKMSDFLKLSSEEQLKLITLAKEKKMSELLDVILRNVGRRESRKVDQWFHLMLMHFLSKRNYQDPVSIGKKK